MPYGDPRLPFLDDSLTQVLLDGDPDPVVVLGADGALLAANPAAVLLCGGGLPGDHLAGLTYRDAHDRQQVATAIEAAGQGTAQIVTVNLAVGDGTDSPLYITLHPVARETGLQIVARLRTPAHQREDASHLAVVMEGVTAARQAQENLERCEDLQHLVGGLARVGGWALEGPERSMYWSQSVYEILDVPSGEEVAFSQAIDLYPPGYREQVVAALNACFERATPFDLDVEIHTYTGRRIPVRAIGRAQQDDDGQVIGVMGAFQDTSVLHAAADRAEALSGQLTRTLECITDAFWAVDDDWRMTDINHRAEQLLVRSRDELLGADLWEAFPEAVGSELDEVYHRVMRTGVSEVIEEFYWHPLDVWLDIHVYSYDQTLAVYFRDVTASRRARLELEARDVQTRWLAALLDKAQDAILVRDLDHTITFWNAAAERIYGWSADDAIGANIRDLLYEDPAEFNHATQAVLDTGEWAGRLTQQTAADEQAVAECRWSLLHDEDGNPDAVLAINADITQLHSAERQLLRAQRLESIGTLAGGVAHDLNNVLSPIMLASGLIRDCVDDSQIQELADIITTSATRGTDLVTQVLYFAQGVEGQRLPVDLDTLLRDIAGMVRDTFPKNIELAMDLPGHIPTVVGDSTQLQQILLNLAINARDAMPDGGTLSIRAFDVELDAQYLAAEAESVAGDYLVIEVEDTGTGMPPEVRDRIFEPFFTTKPRGSGTGLGLSTSLGIVQSHGGFIRVYSDLGLGTRFRIHLPLSSQTDLDEADPPPSGPPPQGSGQTVLVVDDELLIRSTTCQTLQANGYQCLTAGNGAEAVSVFAQHRDQIAAVIVDMMMPVMDGPATIHALQTMDPDLTMIGASGLHGDGKVTQATKAGVRNFLPKPYTARTLLETLSVALGTDVHGARERT